MAQKGFTMTEFTYDKMQVIQGDLSDIRLALNDASHAVNDQDVGRSVTCLMSAKKTIDNLIRTLTFTGE